MKGRVLRWAAALGMTSTTAVLAALLGVAWLVYWWFWLQTPVAFQWVWLPAVNRGTGLDVRCSWGRVLFDGRLRAVDLSVSGRGWRLSAADAVMDVVPRTLLGDRPVIEDLRSREPVLVYAQGVGSSDVQAELWELPVSIHSATVNDMRVEVYRNNRPLVTLDPLDVGVDDLQPGGVGRVTLAAPDLVVSTGNTGVQWQGRLLGSVEIDETGAEGFLYDGNTGLELARADEPDASVQFDLNAKGELSPDGVDGSGSVVATREGMQDGRATGTWSWERGARWPQAKVELEELGPAFLDPLVATQAPLVVQQGVVRGDVSLVPAADVLDFGADLTGSSVVLRTVGAKVATPPMSLQANIEGQVGLELLTLQTIDVGLAHRRKEVARAQLDKPLQVALVEGANGSDSGLVQARITEMPADELRPWAALLGLSALDLVDRGVFSGDLTASIHDGGRAIDIAGEVDVDELWLWSEEAAVGPFEVDGAVAGDLKDLDKLELQPSRAVLLSESGPVAELELSGWAAASGAADIEVSVSAADTIAVGRALSLVPPRAPVKGDEELAGSVGLRAEAGEPWSIGGSLAVGQGTIGIEGAWPRDAGQGEVTLSLAAFDLTPWLRAWQWVGWSELGSMPASGTLTYRGDGAVGIVDGVHTIGPVDLPVDPVQRETVTVNGTSTTRVEGGWLRSEVDAHAVRNGKQTDRVHVLWSMDRNASPRLVDIDGSATELDVDIYSNAFLGLDETAQPKTLTNRLTEQVPVDFDLSAELLDFRVWGLELEMGQLDIASRGGNLVARLENGRFSGGSMRGHLDYRRRGSEPGLSFELDGKGVDVGRLLAFGDPDWEAPVSGPGDLHFTGSGVGSGEALRRDLSGAFTLDAGPGDLRASGLLAAVARVTTVGQFQGMSYDTLTVRLNIDDGVAGIEQMQAVGQRTKLVATGAIALDGRLDVVVQPAATSVLASGLASLIGSEHLKGPDGFTELPVAVEVRGTTEEPTYAARRPLSAGEERRGLWKWLDRRR